MRSLENGHGQGLVQDDAPLSCKRASTQILITHIRTYIAIYIYVHTYLPITYNLPDYLPTSVSPRRPTYLYLCTYRYMHFRHYVQTAWGPVCTSLLTYWFGPHCFEPLLPAQAEGRKLRFGDMLPAHPRRSPRSACFRYFDIFCASQLLLGG